MARPHFTAVEPGVPLPSLHTPHGRTVWHDSGSGCLDGEAVASSVLRGRCHMMASTPKGEGSSGVRSRTALNQRLCFSAGLTFGWPS